MEFKGTQGTWYAVKYACYWSIQTTPYYEDSKDLTDEQEVGERAEYNAILMAAAPDLLKALVRVYNAAKEADLLETLGEEEHEYMKQAISKALTIRQ